MQLRAGMRTAAACGLISRCDGGILALEFVRVRMSIGGARTRYAAFFSKSCFHWPRAARLFIMAR